MMITGCFVSAGPFQAVFISENSQGGQNSKIGGVTEYIVCSSTAFRGVRETGYGKVWQLD